MAKVTEYIRPNRKQVIRNVNLDAEHEILFDEYVQEGMIFEVEQLRTLEWSWTCEVETLNGEICTVAHRIFRHYTEDKTALTILIDDVKEGLDSDEGLPFGS